MKQQMCKGVLWLALVIMATTFVYAQDASTSLSKTEEKGMRWETQLNWEQVKAKAKQEGKYIFMDCYTTWCKPCLQMENTFNDEAVGKAVNDLFINVRMQMDTSKKDNEWVKSRYAEARAIMQQYKVANFPTFLFFSPEGKLVDIAVGFRWPKEFKALFADAVDPGKQYYTLLADYNRGEKDTSTARRLLARKTKYMGDLILAKQIAKDYILQLNKRDYHTKDNIEFIREFTENTHDIGFSIFYQNPKKINEIAGRNGYAEEQLEFFISQEFVDPVLAKAGSIIGNPDWQSMYANIKRKYNKLYADRVVIAAKIRFYSFKKDWTAFIRNTVIYVEKYGENMMDFYLNNNAFYVFQYSNNEDELKTALTWMGRVALNNPTTIDTYANLLYKLNRKAEAITWEEKAVKMDPSNELGLDAILAKMKAGEPTWPID